MKVSPTVAGFSAAAACTRWRSDSAQATASADRLRAAPSSSTQGANPLRMAQSQVGGDLATVAAANHGRRDDPPGLQEGCRVVGVLADAGLVIGIWSLAAGAATPVIDDHPTQSSQLRDRSAPHEGRTPGAVDTEDRAPARVLRSRAGRR